MSVGSWDPGSRPITSADVDRLLLAAGHLEVPDFGLSAEEIARFAALARHGGPVDWQAATAELLSAHIVELIRLFTLAEMRFAGWESGARSPVVPLVATLKERGEYPPTLTRWIKDHTSNRFLPHGSLLDRL